MEQYYLSQDHEYGTIDLADHIADLKDINTFSKLPFALTAPKTTSVVYNIDDVINVTNTAGFPKEYGLFKIGNEIITYTGKTATSFTGCIRGFSGIDSLGSANSPEFFNFNVSNTEIHAESSTVTNLGLVFLAEFYKKYKNQFLPGFESRQFQSINIDNILSRARDFYFVICHFLTSILCIAGVTWWWNIIWTRSIWSRGNQIFFKCQYTLSCSI